MKNIKDWTLDDFLGELNRRMTIEKGKLMETEDYINSPNECDWSPDWRNNYPETKEHKLRVVEDKVYKEVSSILIENTTFDYDKDEKGVSFGKCWVEPHIHEMKHPYLHCDGRYFILTNFYEYDGFLHERLNEINRDKNDKIKNSIKVGDLLFDGFFCWEVLKNNKTTISIRKLKNTYTKRVVDGYLKNNWYGDLIYQGDEFRRRIENRSYSISTMTDIDMISQNKCLWDLCRESMVEEVEYSKGNYEEPSIGWNGKDETIVKLKINHRDFKYQIIKSEKVVSYSSLPFFPMEWNKENWMNDTKELIENIKKHLSDNLEKRLKVS